MISEWFQRVGSSVPRGFSRYFILELLKKKASYWKGNNQLCSRTK